MEFLFVFFGLILVLVLAWFCIRALKNYKPTNGAQNPVTVLTAKAIGQRERIIIIEYRGSEYLLAVSAGNVNLIDKLPRTSATEPSEGETVSREID